MFNYIIALYSLNTTIGKKNCAVILCQSLSVNDLISNGIFWFRAINGITKNRLLIYAN